MCPSGAMSLNSSPLHIQFLKVTLISHCRVVYYDTKDLRRGELGCTGLYWEVVGCTGRFWAVEGCTGKFLSLVGCCRLYLDVLDCIWLYWVVLGSTGLYWALLGCTWLYWAVPFFLEIPKASLNGNCLAW